MTEDISTYVFDLDREVKSLKRDLSKDIRGRFLFFDVDVSSSEDHTEVTSRQVGKKLFQKPALRNEAASEIKEWYVSDPESSSYSHYQIDGLQWIAARKDEKAVQKLGLENEEVLKLFVLYHEIGHALLNEGPKVDEYHPFRECTADAYAALRLFQRFGREAAPMLSMWSWSRAVGAFMGGKEHLTTTVLDKIIADSVDHDFSKLSSAETIDRARSYAEEWTPVPSALAQVKALKEDGTLYIADVFDTTCLSSSGDFAFYIGAKLFQPLARPEGFIANGHPVQFSDDRRQMYANAIEERARGMTLWDVLNAQGAFNGAAPKPPSPPVMQALKVSLPPYQNKFSVRTK